MNPKILSRKKMAKVVSQLRRENRKIVFTNGCFDVLHYGHVAYLRKARGFGEILIVGLNSDSSVKRIKGDSRPINSEKDRAEVLSELECVDYVVLFNEDTPEKLIEIITPDVLVKGSDWEHDKIVGAEHVKSKGGKVKRVKLLKGRSTTDTINRMSENS